MPSVPNRKADSTGLGNRRQRLSDEETMRRMLSTAVEILGRSGLTVSLDHLRLEDVIREAGVSRSAVYRRWPHKDLFLGDLLLELAQAHAPMASTGNAESNELVRRTILGGLARCKTPEGRQKLFAELIRDLATQDFDHINTSGEWKTYLALTVTFDGLPDGELREQVEESLAASEKVLNERIARSTEAVAELLGMRLRKGLALTYDDFANLSNAVARGLVVKSLANPDISTRRVSGTLAGAKGEWSLPALGLAGFALTLLEPNPDVVWDRSRTTSLRKALESTDDLFA